MLRHRETSIDYDSVTVFVLRNARRLGQMLTKESNDAYAAATHRFGSIARRYEENRPREQVILSYEFLNNCVTRFDFCSPAMEDALA